ncbi:MAG: T9SS type A sorting domain-containing protein, partial [Bacteroidota bacterium]
IFPNPASRYIQLSKSENVKRISVINMVGRTMRSFESIETDKKYAIEDLPRGMYLVQLIGTNNKILTTRRLKKQ